ncbi:hypothetical protein AtNW77_Chr1g0081521 [Arabidopsis thaliana]
MLKALLEGGWFTYELVLFLFASGICCNLFVLTYALVNWFFEDAKKASSVSVYSERYL